MYEQALVDCVNDFNDSSSLLCDRNWSIGSEHNAVVMDKYNESNSVNNHLLSQRHNGANGVNDQRNFSFIQLLLHANNNGRLSLHDDVFKRNFSDRHTRPEFQCAGGF